MKEWRPHRSLVSKTFAATAIAALTAFRNSDHLAAETMHIVPQRGASKDAREPLLAAVDD